MGKFVILPQHASNECFYLFQNCLVYRTDDELRECIRRAESDAPRPLSSWERRRLSWASATVHLVQHMLARRRTTTARNVLLQGACSATQRAFAPRPMHNMLRSAIGVRGEPLTIRDQHVIALITLIVATAVCVVLRHQSSSPVV